jgi:L-lactate dehydrogenase (cytochrome)
MTDAQPFANYQNEIYFAGLGGTLPQYPVAWDDLEARAAEKLDAGAHGYIAGGAGAEDTMRANREAFRRWRIVPRMLRDVSARDLHTEVLGTPMPAPVMCAPIGVQSIAHPDGELATARAAGSLGVPMIASTASSYTMEEIAQANGDGPRWYQLYWPRDPELAASFLERAEKSDYQAVVVTLDTWLLAWRPRDLQNSYLPFLRATGIANYLSDPVFNRGLDGAEDAQKILKFLGVFSDPSVTWESLQFIRDHTSLPIVLKGILHPLDARRALDAGVNGIVVSNHGGRQVDGAIGALDALPAVVEAVAGRIPVLFDSGVRGGADAFKALALGARAVLLGRPYMYGLALGGEDGVRTVLRSFLAELDLTLALSGYTRFADVDQNALREVR